VSAGDDGEFGLEGLDENFDLTEQVEIEAAAAQGERSERLKSMLRQRKVSYGRVFDTGGATADDIKLVVADLRNFCRYKRSTFHPNVQHAARLDGRREVVLRIDEYIELTVDELLIKLA